MKKNARFNISEKSDIEVSDDSEEEFSSIKKEKAKNTLLKHIDKAFRDGKELDVTKIKREGTYTRIRDKTTGRSTRKGIGVAGFPVISETFSAFKKAMNILGPEYSQYTELYKFYHGDDDNKNIPKDLPDIENILNNYKKDNLIDFIPPPTNQKNIKFIGNEKTIYGFLPDKSIRKTQKSKRKTAYNFTKNIGTEWEDPSDDDNSQNIKSSMWRLKLDAEKDSKEAFTNEINEILSNPYYEEKTKEIDTEMSNLTLDFLKTNKPRSRTVGPKRKTTFKDLKSTLKPRFTEYYEIE